MAEIARAVVQLIPSFSGGTGMISKELSGPAEKAGRESGDKAGRGFKGTFLAGLKGIAAPLAGLFAGAQVVGFFKDSITAASGLAESINALDVSFGDASAGVQELGRGAAQSLGLSNLEFNNLAVRFSSFAKTVAGEGGDVVGTLDDLTTRSADFASVMNIDVAQAAQIFQSGLAGESEPLRQFGIDMSAAAVTAYALENGISTSAASMTEAEKVQARYGLLMQETTAHAGDFANTSDSLANQQRILGAEFANTQVKVGQQLLPAMQGLVSFATGTLLPGFERLIGFVVDELVPGIAAFAAKVNEWKTPIGVVAGVITAVFIPALIALGVQQTIAAAKAVAAWAVQTAASIRGAAAQSLAVVRTVAGWALMATQSLLHAARMAAAWLIAMGPVGWVIAIIIGLAALIIANWDKIVAWTKQAWSNVTAWLSSAWANIKSAAVSAWNALVSFFRGVIDGIVRLFLNWTLPGLLIKHWSSIRTAAVNAWNNILAFFQQIPGRVMAALAALGQLGVRIGGYVLRMRDVVVSHFNNVVAFVQGIPGRIVAALGNLGTRLYSAGQQLIQGLISGISTKVRAAVDAVRNAVGSVIDGAKNLLGIASPSKVFAGFGRDIGEGLRLGIDGQRSAVQDATDRLVSLPTAARANLDGVRAGGVAAGGGGGTTINVTADPRFAEQQARLIVTRLRDNVAVFGLTGLAAGA